MGIFTVEKLKLSKQQIKAILYLVSNLTCTQGCEKAEINKTTFYTWLKQPDFEVELDLQRNEIIEAAFVMIAQNTEKAVSTLVGLMVPLNDSFVLVSQMVCVMMCFPLANHSFTT